MIRRVLLETRQDFTFEAVLSTERNLLFLEEAKKTGIKSVQYLCLQRTVRSMCGVYGHLSAVNCL